MNRFMVFLAGTFCVAEVVVAQNSSIPRSVSAPATSELQRPASGSAIPPSPSSSSFGYRIDGPANAAEGVSAAASISRSAVEGAQQAGHAMGGSLDAASSRALGRVDTGKSVVQHGAGLYGAYRDGDAAGMATYGGQAVFEEGLERAGQAAAGAYTAWRGATLLTPGVGAAFWGGTVVGGLLQNVEVGGRTIQDHVTDAYWSGTERIMHRIDRRTDPDWITSQENIERHRQLLRQRHAAQFDAMARQNEHAAQAAAQTRVTRSAPEAPSGAQVVQLLGATLGTAAALQSRQSVQAPVRPQAPACNKTYNTPDGCHPGHDEKSHPGGCRC